MKIDFIPVIPFSLILVGGLVRRVAIEKQQKILYLRGEKVHRKELENERGNLRKVIKLRQEIDAKTGKLFLLAIKIQFIGFFLFLFSSIFIAILSM